MIRHHTIKNKENEICPVKIDRVDAEIQAYTHTHTHTRTHTHTHIHIIQTFFQKQCILIPNASENNYKMFLQQLKKLLSQSFLYEEEKKMVSTQPNGLAHILPDLYFSISYFYTY